MSSTGFRSTSSCRRSWVTSFGPVRSGLGERYGLAVEIALLRLQPLLSPAVESELTDTRNQLDTATRICAMSFLAIPVTVVLLWSHEMWLLVPLGCYLLGWAAYRSAIAAAQRFCEALAVAFDLYHLQLWDALSSERPTDLLDEREKAKP